MEQNGNNEATEKVVPLDLMVYTAKTIVDNALSAIKKDIGLPDYLIDGVLSLALLEVRRREISELSKKLLNEERGD